MCTDETVLQSYPITCLRLARKKCYFGFGSSVAIVDPPGNKLERVLTNCGEKKKIIGNIAVRKLLWVSSKDSSIIRCLEPGSGHLKGSLNCMEVCQALVTIFGQRVTIKMFSCSVRTLLRVVASYQSWHYMFQACTVSMGNHGYLKNVNFSIQAKNFSLPGSGCIAEAQGLFGCMIRNLPKQQRSDRLVTSYT